MIPCILQNEVIAAGAVITRVSTPPVVHGHVFTAMSVAAIDRDTTVATSVEIGVLDGSAEIPIDATDGPFPIGVSHTLYWPSMLLPGQSYYAKFSTPAQGDRLFIVAHGYLDPMYEGGHH